MKNSNLYNIYTSIKSWILSKRFLFLVFLLTFVLFFIFLWGKIVVTISAGKAGVIFHRFSGTEIDTIYKEGVHIISPLDTLTIYEVRKKIAFHEFDIISLKGLTIHLALAIRYRPKYALLGILHQKVGPNYLSRIVLPQIESVMRKQLGNYTAEHIYTNKSELLTNTILKALDEVGRNYVEVDDIIIRSITLPKEIRDAIESKLKQEEFMKSYEFRLKIAKKEADRLKIEALGIKVYHETIDHSLTESILRHKGIEATEKLAKSNNAKVVIIGSGKDGLPIILNTESNNRSTNIVSDDKSK